MCIRDSLKALAKNKVLEKSEGTVRTFLLSFVKICLYIVLVISIISILGVPMASVLAVLASAGVAVGLALQGALSNLAGGIMPVSYTHLDVYKRQMGIRGKIKMRIVSLWWKPSMKKLKGWPAMWAASLALVV